MPSPKLTAQGRLVGVPQVLSERPVRKHPMRPMAMPRARGMA
jgi:hypothetical protein